MARELSLDGYDIVELIGFGGTGEVWRALELETGETVAIKRLRARHEVAASRLRREAAVLRAVAGPHVIGVRAVVEIGTDDGRHPQTVLVLDYAPGGSLATVLGVRGRLSAAEVVTVLAPLAAALASIHEQGLVHGDVAPANILFTRDGRPLLADCGVAHAVGDPKAAVEGTPEYADPAVLAGGDPVGASDVYSLAAVGFAALTSQPPVSDDVARLRAGLGETPAGLADAIVASLAPDPLDRPAAADLARAVVRSCAAAPVRLVTTPMPEPVPTTQPLRPARLSESSELAEPAAPTPNRRSGRASRGLVVGALAMAAMAGAVGAGTAWARAQRSPSIALPVVVSSPPVAARSATVTPPVATPSAAPDWRSVVSELAAARDKVFAAPSLADLDSVYTSTASARAGDLATVHSLASRGLHVVGLRTVVRSVQPIHVTKSTATARVTDIQSAYQVLDSSGRLAGRGQGRGVRRFTMSLAMVDGHWRIAGIRE